MYKCIIIALTLTTLLMSACNTPEENVNNLSVTETLLLKNYRPQSIYQLEETIIQKAKYPAIDMHSHVYATNKEELDSWVETMDACGIAMVHVMTQKHGPAFDSVADLYSSYPDRFKIWCGIDYSAYETDTFSQAAIRELRRCVKKGAVGIGELGDKGRGLFYCTPKAYGMHPDDPRMSPVWQAAAEMNIPVSLHVADPKWMYETMDSTNDGMMNAYKWRLDNQEGIKEHSEMMEILENTLKKNPKTIFIACHFANCTYDHGIISNMLDNYQNLYLDNSARYAEMSAIPRAAKGFYENYQDRIVYGTDMGRNETMYRITFRLLETADEHLYLPYNSYHWALHALNLDDDVLEKIYRTNALKIMEQDS